MHRSLLLFLVGLTIASGLDIQESSGRVKRQAHRSIYPSRTTTADGVPILTESYSRSRAASPSTRQNQPTHPDQGLSLYEDFVNDPWKPTQDLHSIVSERGRTPYTPQRELRTGYQTDTRDDLWNRRNAARPATPTGRPVSQDRSDWAVSSQTGDHVTYVRRKPSSQRIGSHERPESFRGGDAGWRGGSRTRSWENYYQQPPHGENGNKEWIVESRSDGHITYRRRGTLPYHGRSGVQRLGQGQGEVLARVVDTKDGDYSPNTYGQYQQGWKPSLQLKSGDSVSYRNKDGSEVTFPRYRDGDGGRRVTFNPPPTVRPERYEREGDWRVVSKDDSHITWTRVGSDYEYRATRPATTTARPYYYPTRKPTSPWNRESRAGGGPHYPMLHEKETADRANRVGTSNRLAVVY